MISPTISNHLAFLSYDKIRKVCRPLFQSTSIQYFCYQYLDADGYYTLLLTCPDPAYLLFQEDAYQNSWLFTNSLGFPCRGYIIWDIAKQFNTKEQDELTSNFSKMQLIHGIDVVQYHGSHHEFFTFVSNKPDIYQCSFKLLYQFIFFFRQECDQLINLAKQEKFFVPSTKLETPRLPIFDNLPLDVYEINPFPMKKYYLQNNSRSICLTTKEISCLAHAASGKTAKEIAQVLQISYRTVESHMSHIKSKLDCSQLIEAINVAKQHHIL